MMVMMGDATKMEDDGEGSNRKRRERRKKNGWDEIDRVSRNGNLSLFCRVFS